MKIDLPNQAIHYWSTTVWCALGAIVFGAVAVISCWIKRCRHSVRYQYTALDSGIGAPDRSPRERAARDRAFTACQEWLQNEGNRYEVIAHLDDIGSRPNKHWFLLNDCNIRTDRLMTLLSLPPDCVALEELPPSECPKGVLMELLGSLQHPYIYPVLDLGFHHTESHHYASLVMPFNPRGSLKDLIYKSQWNEPWNRKYTRKSSCLPMSQVQRLGRQILEALLFLKERGIQSHGHLHSGNVIIQNGVARLSGLENGLLGLNSRVNSIVWARNAPDIEYIDVICFGHLLFEMCTGYELTSPQPTPGHYQLDLERYPQVVEILQIIFDQPDCQYPSVEELVLCDLFRNIDLREMRGTCVPSFKHGLSSSTLNLLNAVRRRQGVILSGSYSEGSSPCTPPSTPRDRKTGNVEESTDLSSSDSDDMLDEIVVHEHYDPLNSPIHYCDNLSSGHLSSDDNNSTIIRIASELQHCVHLQSTSNEQCSMNAKTSQGTSHQQQLTPSLAASGYKNSKSRRMEYSRRAYGLGTSNPSQDSAFGSMTDGECSRTSSFKFSSFQSITSPIDEGVEDDIIESGQSDSNHTSPNHLNVSPTPYTSSPVNRLTNCNVNKTKTFLEPPKLIINDTSTNSPLFYTTSPIRRCATTEVFSQKYRVSSFEDMSMYASSSSSSVNRLTNCNVNKTKTFRSFDDGKKLTVSDPSPDRVTNSKTKKHNQLTTSNFTARERQTLWRSNLVKSNECVYETSFSGHLPETSVDRFILTPEPVILNTNYSNTSTNKKRPSSRQLFSLAKFKHNTILDSIGLEDFPEEEKNDHHSTSAPSTNDNNNKSSANSSSSSSNTSSTSSDDISENSSVTDTLLISPTSSLIYEKTGCVEENTPLLDYDMETISPG